MRYGLIIGLGAGLASALLFYSAARGSPLLGTMLVLLTPLPSMLAGLGWGWLPAALGALAGSALMAAVASLPFAVGYFLALGAPVALVAYLAYLSRPHPHDAAQREWYPAGRLVAALSLYGGALPLLVLPLIGGTYEILRAPHGRVPAPPVGARRARARHRRSSTRRAGRRARRVVRLRPAGRAWRPIWLGIFALNLYLAGRVARASGRLGRDWPDLPSLAYPLGFQLLLAAGARRHLRAGRAGRGRRRPVAARCCSPTSSPGSPLMHFIARAPRALDPLAASTPGVLFIEPYTSLAADARRTAGARSQAQATLRRIATRQPPEPINHGQRSTPCKSFFSSASAASARWATSSTSRTATPATSSCRRRRRCAPPRRTSPASRGQRAQLEARDLELKKEAEAVAAKLEGKSFLAIRQAGDTGQLYGSVTSRDIAEVITAGGFSVDRRQVDPRQADQDARRPRHPHRPAPGGDGAGDPQRRPLRGRGRAAGARRGRHRHQGREDRARDVRRRRRVRGGGAGPPEGEARRRADVPTTAA